MGYMKLDAIPEAKFICDTKADLATLLPRPSIGDTCWVIAEAVEYMCNSKQEWVKQSNASSVVSTPVGDIDLSNYVTLERLQEELSKINMPEVDLSDYAKKNEIPNISELQPKGDYALKSEIPSVSGLATEEFVVNKIAEAELNDKDVDLSSFYTKSEVDDKMAIFNAALRILGDDPNGFAIKVNAADNKTFITVLGESGPGLYTCYIQKGVEDNPAGLESSCRGFACVNTWYNVKEFYAWILMFDDKGNLYTRYMSAYGASDWKLNTIDLGGYVTSEELLEAINNLNIPSIEGLVTTEELNNYQPKGDYLTEHQVLKTINGESIIGEGNIEIKSETPDLAGYATEDFVNEKVVEVQSTINVELLSRFNLVDGNLYFDNILLLSGIKDIDISNGFKVLFIGNSYSEDTCAFMYELASAIGFAEEDIDISYLYKASCTLDTHWTNASNNIADYLFCRVKGKTDTYLNSIETISSASTIADAVSAQNWNWIIFQQGSKDSGKVSSYSNLQNLIDYVKTYVKHKDTKYAFNMTWAYKNGYSNLSAYDNSQSTMYNSICEAVQSEVLTKEDISKVIPCGTAIQNARGLVPFDHEFSADGTHLNGDGSFVAGLTCVLTLLNGTEQLSAIGDYRVNTLKPENGNVNTRHDYVSTFDNVHIYDYVLAAKRAVKAPYILSISDFLENYHFYHSQELCPIDTHITKSPAFPLENTTNSAGKTVEVANAISSNFMATRLFTPITLPIGSTITITSGYQVRPERFVDYNTYNKTREDNTKTTINIDETFWNGYQYAGFNISNTQTTTSKKILSTEVCEQIYNNEIVIITKP